MNQWLTHEFGNLWVIEAEDDVPSIQPAIDVRFGEVDRQDIEALAAAMGDGSREMIEERFAASRRCFAGWVEDRIAVYGWVSYGQQSIGEMERHIRLGPADAYLWDFVTLPAYRRNRLYIALLCFIIDTLREDGTQRIWIGSALSNEPSVRAFASSGFRPVLRAYYVRLLRLHLLLLAGNRNAPERLVNTARQAFARADEYALGSLYIRF